MNERSHLFMTASITAAEIASQPALWRASAALAPVWGPELLAEGQRMLAIGCGTSAFVAEAFAWLREDAGLGETRAAFASDPPRARRWDRLVAVCRSGTTTEILDAVAALRPRVGSTVSITGVPDSPVVHRCDRALVLADADERSIMQTRFPTSVLALVLAAVGEPVEALLADAETALAAPLPADPAGTRHVVFLGRRWTLGLAHEAALKVREAAQAWSESYPALDYRHGPIAVAGPGSLVWPLGEVPTGLVRDIRRSGAQVADTALHPLAELVLAQRFAVAMAAARGLDPDRPRQLTRSVIINDDGSGAESFEKIRSLR